MLEQMTQTHEQTCVSKTWTHPSLERYTFAGITLKTFNSMQFKPWTETDKANKIFITDSTLMYHMWSKVKVPQNGWVDVGIHIDNCLIIRVLGKNGGIFAGEGDAIARQTFAEMKFNSVAVMPIFGALPPNLQKRFTEHERAQRTYLSEIPTLPAIMDLDKVYKQIGFHGLYNNKLKYHVRPCAFNWFISALCNVAADFNFIIGWNACKRKNSLPVIVEFSAQRKFLDDHCTIRGR